ncbi:hypothetical protein [Joostella sp. CR20]|uniref:hypothetical protein n=1 Tax=Joostella sp. CR20 TaxID=2804312 RepID=UPI00313A7DC4
MKNKTKNMIFVGGFLLVLFICYQFSFSKTLSLYSAYTDLKKERVLFESIPKQHYMLVKQNRYLDSLLNEYQIGGTSLQNNLLKALNANKDSLGFKLVTFNKTHIFKQEQLTVNSHVFTLEGTFEVILKLLYNVEQRAKFGEILHVYFEKKKDFRSKKERLEVNVIIQNFK